MIELSIETDGAHAIDYISVLFRKYGSVVCHDARQNTFTHNKRLPF